MNLETERGEERGGRQGGEERIEKQTDGQTDTCAWCSLLQLPACCENRTVIRPALLYL